MWSERIKMFGIAVHDVSQHTQEITIEAIDSPRLKSFSRKIALYAGLYLFLFFFSWEDFFLFFFSSSLPSLSQVSASVESRRLNMIHMFDGSSSARVCVDRIGAVR